VAERRGTPGVLVTWLRDRTTVAPAATLALVAALVHGTPVHSQLVPDSVGRVSYRVRPDTVTVGQPFVLTVRAIAPRGRIAIPPAVPDSGGMIEPLDPADVSRRGDTLLVQYRLLAWQPGVLTIPVGPVLMRQGASELSVPVDARVVVASVLPADSALRTPRQPRGLLAVVAPWWEDWWLWVLALIVGISLLYLLYRFRTRDRTPKVAVVSPLSRAEAAFARLDARELVEVGEGGRYVALAAEIVRQYLADIESTLPTTLTNGELLAAVGPVQGMPDKQLAQLLQLVDAVRFAGRDIDPDAVQRVSGLSRELVRNIDRVRSAISTQAA